MKISNIDKSNLRKVILSTADQFKEGISVAKNININIQFSRIMISGMGGSALHANILRIILNDIAKKNGNYKVVEVYQNRFYKLPPEAYDDCLNIICSHSGNTEETISSFEEVLKNDLPCIGISSGGIIEKMCKENNVPHIKLPIPFENFQPRMATGHFVFSILQILVNAKKLPKEVVEVDRLSVQLKNITLQMEPQGQMIAKNLVSKIPIIYASTKFKALAMIWKIKINENAKTPAFWNYFPELNHNEFVGFSNSQARFYIIMIRDLEDHPRNLLRYELTAEFLRKKGIKTKIIDMLEGGMSYRIFTTIALSDWVSYYLALEYKQDPTPVDMVEDLKRALK